MSAVDNYRINFSDYVLNEGKAQVRNNEYNGDSECGSRYVKKVPVLYERKEDCSGCSACCAICPKQAIQMIPDEEGFDYPSIDAKLCVRCQLCIKVCPFK